MSQETNTTTKQQQYLSEKDYKQLTKAFQDPKIFNSLLEYYDQVKKANQDDNNANIENSYSNNSSNSNHDKSSSSGDTTNTTNTTSNSQEIKVKTKKVNTVFGFCFKTHSNKRDKVFVCVSHYPTVEPASVVDGKGWIIPYSLFPLERQQSSFTSPYHSVYHIVYSTETYNESVKVPTLHRLLLQTAVQAIGERYAESLNIAVVKMTKKMFGKELIVQVLDQPTDINLEEPPPKEFTNPDDNTIQPVHYIEHLDKHKKKLDNMVIIPSFIAIDILLPKLNNIDDLEIDIEQDDNDQDEQQYLVVSDLISKYNLRIKLKHKVDDEPLAKYNKTKKILSLTLVVKEDHSHSHNHSHSHSHTHTHGHDHTEAETDLHSNNNNNNNQDTIEKFKNLNIQSDPLVFSSNNQLLVPSLSFPILQENICINSTNILLKQTLQSILIILYINTNEIDKESTTIVNNNNNNISISFRDKNEKKDFNFNLFSEIVGDVAENNNRTCRSSIHSQSYTKHSIVFEFNKQKSIWWNEILNK